MREDGQRLAACTDTSWIAREQEVCASTIVVGQKPIAANIHLIEVDGANQLIAAIAHVPNLKHRLEPYLTLNAKVVFIDSRKLHLRIDEKSDVGPWRKRIDAREGYRRRDKGRRGNWRRVVNEVCQPK